MDRTGVTGGACLPVPRRSSRGFAGGWLARSNVKAATEAVAVLWRAGGDDGGGFVMSVVLPEVSERMRLVRHGEMMLLAAGVQDASDLRDAQEAGAWRRAGATRRRWRRRGFGRCAFRTCGIRLARGCDRAEALSRQYQVTW
jgi:hypothetical protein